MPRPIMNAHPISTVARPMAHANGRQSLLVYRSDWRLIAERRVASQASASGIATAARMLFSGFEVFAVFTPITSR